MARDKRNDIVYLGIYDVLSVLSCSHFVTFSLPPLERITKLQRGETSNALKRCVEKLSYLAVGKEIANCGAVVYGQCKEVFTI